MLCSSSQVLVTSFWRSTKQPWVEAGLQCLQIPLWCPTCHCSHGLLPGQKLCPKVMGMGLRYRNLGSTARRLVQSLCLTVGSSFNLLVPWVDKISWQASFHGRLLFHPMGPHLKRFRPRPSGRNRFFYGTSMISAYRAAAGELAWRTGTFIHCPLPPHCQNPGSHSWPASIHLGRTRRSRAGHKTLSQLQLETISQPRNWGSPAKNKL